MGTASSEMSCQRLNTVSWGPRSSEREHEASVPARSVADRGRAAAAEPGRGTGAELGRPPPRPSRAGPTTVCLAWWAEAGRGLRAG